MTRMVGTGEAPQGYYEGQIFDVAENDEATVEDLERKGWARRVEPKDDPGRTKVQIANSIVRGDLLNHPDDAAVAEEIGGHDEALAIVHTENPDATPEDYEQEAEEGRKFNAIGQPYTDPELARLNRDAAKAQAGARGGASAPPEEAAKKKGSS